MKFMFILLDAAAETIQGYESFIGNIFGNIVLFAEGKINHNHWYSQKCFNSQ